MTSEMNNRRQERFWNHLLAIVSNGTMVPVVGEDMLTLPATDGELLYDVLARSYAEYAGLEVGQNAPNMLSSVVRSHPDFSDNPHDVYQELGEEFAELNPDIPEPLLNLAKIRHFNLFVSTTFDDLLERAINQVRFDGQQRTLVIPYSPKKVPSDSALSEALASGRPIIFQLFGSCRNPLHFTLTEGDLLEYMHALQSTEYCPKRLFDELYERPLLLLGNRFPDWFTRLFLRMTRKTPLYYRDVPKQYFADSTTVSDPGLKYFLQKFTTNTVLVEEFDTVSFVEELAKRWQDRCGGTEPVPGTLATGPGPDNPMPVNAVFISYCATTINEGISQDSRIAMAVRDALEAAGISVWLDRDQLQGGDDYERKIQRYIRTCSVFMPLVSNTTESRSSGFFRKEWNWALKRLPDFTGSDRQFLFPVALDAINPYQASVPEEFRNYQFTQLSDGRPDEAFVSSVRSIYEKALSEARGRMK